ncbi:DEAD/DEAH box helicase family protein [Schaalia sp. Marseille-Q2122]|uniref:restriction endonuclease n=1 Tax=Schaalia sp. Marseille-Q2122 TaxID=2736604 RepID=UPI0015897637|nr:DEAD/DEAH box helicase family protein [Schaalia sp. Marseille-Q2122]
MRFTFDAHQPYQLQAIESVVDLFNGQPQDAGQLPASSQPGSLAASADTLDIEIGAVGNALALDEDAILTNLRTVQDRNALPLSDALVDGLQFDIEMETGTGKTYVYLRTAFELAKRYAFRKFIILVPSVAIREGVNTSIALMREHFRQLYPGQPFDAMVYSGKTPEDVRAFATSTGVQIMVMTIDSIRGDKESRIIHQERDTLGARPIDFLQATQPVVIMDEPQNMESELSQRAITELNPLCTLRYSATHRKGRNLIYRLDPIDAHELGLVKQIVVAGTETEGEAPVPYIRLCAVKNTPTLQAQLELIVRTPAGALVKKKKWVKSTQDLQQVTKNAAYDGNWRITDIYYSPNDDRSYIELTNLPTPLHIGEETGGKRDDIYREMIRETIREHLRKEHQLRGRGIKVISLFFIDKVANYLGDGHNSTDANGPFVQWFDQILDEERRKNPQWSEVLPHPSAMLRSAYFAQKSSGKKADKTVTFVDSSGKTKSDDEAYSLIMKDKARLLSLEEPVRFIFSHSALREGWDNPNVFQICTLRDMAGETERRQTIGRGLRLPVNQEGERLQDRSIAQLTVIANESYRAFADALQSEYREAGVSLGVVRPEEFARIVIPSDTGVEEHLGSDISRRLWQSLVDKGFLDDKGTVQPLFTPDIEGFSLYIDGAYKWAEPEMIEIVKKCRIDHTVKPIRKRQTRTLNKELYLSPEFEAFWEAISRRTTYRVGIDRETLIQRSVDAITSAPSIRPIEIVTSRAELTAQRGGFSTQKTSERHAEVDANYPLPDIVTELSQETSLTRRTIIDIMRRSGRLTDFLANPAEYTRMIRHAITTELAHLLIEGIQYEEIGGSIYELRELQQDGREEKSYFTDQLYRVRNSDKTDFDYLVYDSSVEESFARELDGREDIRFFMKLPPKFLIPTPLGNYNPDWAIIKRVDGEDRIYMVRETKSTHDARQRRAKENAKIAAASKHFAAIGIDYAVSAPEEWNLEDTAAGRPL